MATPLSRRTVPSFLNTYKPRRCIRSSAPISASSCLAFSIPESRFYGGSGRPHRDLPLLCALSTFGLVSELQPQTKLYTPRLIALGTYSPQGLIAQVRIRVTPQVTVE